MITIKLRQLCDLISPNIKISRVEHGLYLTYLRSLTREQILQGFTLKSKTPHPVLVDFLQEWFVRQSDQYKQDEKDGNVCAICYVSMRKNKAMDACPTCKHTDVHSSCINKYVKQTGKVNCPFCRSPLGVLARKRRPSRIRDIFRSGRHWGMSFVYGPTDGIVNDVAEYRRQQTEEPIGSVFGRLFAEPLPEETINADVIRQMVSGEEIARRTL